MTFLFVMMQKLSQNNYVYDKFYEAVMIYNERKCSSFKFSRKCHKLSHYKTMMFFVIITCNIIIVVVLDLLVDIAVTCHYWTHILNLI
jgi:hypothetical protein